MEFVDQYVDTVIRFSLGREVTTKTLYLSIPVGNALVDYEEYYRIDELEYEQFIQPGRAVAFVEKCRARMMDDRLIMLPGRDRGVAL